MKSVDKKILKLICILFIVSMLIMGYLVLFCDLEDISKRVYLNIVEYFSYLDNVLICLFFIITFINSIIILIYAFYENKKEI